jgi:hypothetical protein
MHVRGVFLVSMSKSICSRIWLGALALGVASFANSQAIKPDAGQSMLKARPSTFTKNVGQWDPKALFGGHSAGMDFWISKEGFVFQYQRTGGDKGNAKFAGHTVGMLFDGAKPFVAVGSDEAGVREYMGNKDLPVAQKYRKVKLSGVYDKVDAIAYFDGKAPRYDFVVHPGADSNNIRFAFKGAAAKVVSKDKIQINTVLGDRFQEGLFAYQMEHGKKVSVPVSFKQIDSTHIGFNVGSFDKSEDLIIDPLVFGTYYGGDQGWDEVRGVAADADGNVYLTGYTRSNIYPVLYGPFGFNKLGGRDAFFSRLTADVYVHDYSALIPGTGNEQGNFVKLDPLGNIWVVGSTSSTSLAGDSSAGNMWIMRFSLDPTTVLTPFHAGNPVFFRFGGPTATPDVSAITSFSMRPDSSITPGATIRMLLTGLCNTTNGATGLVSGANSGSFYATLDYNETTGFSTVGGSSGFAAATGATTTTITGSSYDVNGNFFLSGTLNATGNSDTSGPSPIFDTTGSTWSNSHLQRQKDIYIRKFAASGTMVWSGLIGGADNDVTEGKFSTHTANLSDIGGSTIATDPQGNVYVLGRSASFDFPRTSGVFGEIYQSGENYITVTKIKSDGSQILYSTNIRNHGVISASGIGVDNAGNAYITGVVGVATLLLGTPGDPVVPDANLNAGSIPLVNPIRGAYVYPTVPEASTNDAWLLILDSTASSVIRSTYIGGILDEGIFAPFVDPNGDVWVFGWADTWRYYQRVSSTGTVTEYIPNGRFGGLDPAFITNLAFKQFPEPPTMAGILVDSGHFIDNGLPNINMQYCRDGFILRFRESLPLISNMTLTPSPIPGGDPQGLANPPFSVGTITLSGPAPAGGATVKLTLDTPTAASFLSTSDSATSTVIIPAGSTTGTYNVYSKVVLAPVNVQIKANYSGNLKTATVQIVPWLSSITINGSSVVGGNTTTATVKLAANAPAGGVVVDLSTDLAGIVSFPGGNQVTVLAGSNVATFVIATNGVDVASTAQITATLLGVARTGTLGINVAKLTNIVLTPNPVAAGSSVTGVVNLDGKTGAAGTLNISINGAPAGYVITPSQVTIPANSNQSAQFTITTPMEAADIGRVVKAVRVVSPVDNTVIDGPVTATLNVQALLVSSLTLDPTTISSGGTSTATVSLGAAAPAGGAIVNVSSNKPGLALPVDVNGMPITQVIVPQGLTQATFLVQGLFALNGDEDAIISAYRGPTPTVPALVQSATLRVLALTYSMTITPNSVFGGQGATGKITLSAPAIPGFAMNTITCDTAGVTFAQPVFTTGSATATFAISTPVVSDTVTATFTASAGTLPDVMATLTIKATEVLSIKILPKNTVRQGTMIQIQVTVNRNVPGATSGKITFTNASLVILPIGQNFVNFTVPAGSSTAIINLTTRRVPRNLSTQVTATVSPSGTGATASTVLNVTI